MPRLNELPSEILLALPLSRSDNSSMVKVCQSFGEIFTSKLYNCITFPDEFDMNSSRYRRNWDLKKRLPLLLNTLLSSYPCLGTQVHTMKFLTGRHSEPYSSELEWTVHQILQAIAPQLKHLFIVPDERHHYYFHWDTGDYPKLQMLAISDTRYLGHEKVLHIASQPSMRLIELHKPVGWNSADYTYSPIRDPLKDSVYRNTKGKEIIVNRIQILPKEIKEIIRTFTEVETFIYIKDTSHCGWSDRDNIESDHANSFCICLFVQELDSILDLIQHSAQNLVLIQSQSDQCEYDFTILHTLRHLVKLRNLCVDIHFILGSHAWRDDSPRYIVGVDKAIVEPDVPTRPLASLAHLLPQGLERLELQVRQVELSHNPNYCVEIIQGLVENNNVFKELKFVTVEEMQDPEYHMKDPPGESPVTETMIRTMQDDCAAIGVHLTYIKRGWKVSIRKERFVSVEVDPPFHVRLYEPGTDVKESTFLWRMTDHMRGRTVTREDSKRLKETTPKNDSTKPDALEEPLSITRTEQKRAGCTNCIVQ